jgi:uncharacterized protein YbbC (DUF1343 family)
MTAPHPVLQGARVRFGVDRVASAPTLLPAATRVGLVTNDAARLAGDAAVHGRLALRAAGLPLVRLFAPEHGLTAVGEDGAPMRDGTDPLTGLPVVSLYGERFAPPDATLDDLDLLLFDIPDVGARFYTYAWTLSHVMESCARLGLPLVVLDRPNPSGGMLDGAEGPMLDEEHCGSFIGRWSIPVRHALTLGELARYWAATRLPALRLTVIACDGWHRSDLWPSLALPWVPPSPAMPSFEGALLYPGTCLFEGTTLSVGRGTAFPFQGIAAPWLDPDRLVDAVGDLGGRAGVRFVAGHVTPAMAPYKDEACALLRIVVTDPDQLRPVALALTLMAAAFRTFPESCTWAPYPTAANPSGGDHFVRLVGRRAIAQRLAETVTPVTPQEIAHWTDTGPWQRSVRGVLLYDDRH